MQQGKLCELSGVGKSTATSKARSFEQMMGISYLDPRWTLPSKQENNPLIRMLNVNGLAMDIHLFREHLAPFVGRCSTRSCGGGTPKATHMGFAS